MVNITIDGIKMEVEENLTILEAARQSNIDIPTLCDHETLTPYGGCRLCVVEVEGARTLQPSCTLPVSKDMVVRTNTERVRSARKFILTMIFSERNHFCPYCNVTGGDCELQNSAYGEDMTHWPIQPNWQPFPMDASHPFIVLEHNRCILCRRCVRACNELVGNFTLEFADRGTDSMLVADLDVPLGESSCISCGTCVQVCPTGTLIDKWSAYQGKCVDVDSTNTICQQCSVGCNIKVLTRDNRLVRIEGDWDGPINGGVICEVGRFLPMVESRKRIVKPMLRKDGHLTETDWTEALQESVTQIRAAKESVAGIVSSKLSLEALDVFKQIGESQKFMSLNSTEFGAYTQAGYSYLSNNGKPFESKLAHLEESDVFFVVGEDLTKDHQVVSFFIKRTLPKGAKLIQVNSNENGFGLFADAILDVKKKDISKFLEQFNAYVDDPSEEKISALSDNFNLDEETLRITISLLSDAKSPIVVLGSRSETSADYFEASVNLAKAINGNFISTKGNINSLGAAQLLLDNEVLKSDADLFVIANGDEDVDEKLDISSKKKTFKIVFSTFISDLTEDSDIVFPVANWLEEGGHFLNLDGHLLTANSALVPPEGILTNLEALEKLAAALNVKIKANWKEPLDAISVVDIKK